VIHKNSFLAFGSALLLSASAASADPISLVNGFNVMVRQDMTLKADVGGRVAVGGNATFNGFAVGSGDNANNGAALAANPSRIDLVVGGHAALTNGSVNKGSAQAGTATTHSVGFHTAGSSLTTGGTPSVDFASTFMDLSSLSVDLFDLAGNGTAVNQWGGLNLTGTDATLNVFTLTTGMLSGLNAVNITVPTTSTVLFNVAGSSLTMQYLGMNVNGQQDNAMSSQMLWNFMDMSQLTLNGLGWRGSILAPLATVNFANGNINGQVMVNNLYTDWGGEYHNHAFTGDLPVDDVTPPTEPSSVPEPAGLAAVGVAAMLMARRLKRKNVAQ